MVRYICIYTCSGANLSYTQNWSNDAAPGLGESVGNKQDILATHVVV